MRLKRGKKIAASESFVSAPIHASIAGKVVSVDFHYTPIGTKIRSIVIESNGSDEHAEGLNPSRKTLDDLSKEEIVQIIREAGGIVGGMGGAAFPTHVKISLRKARR